ncbi:MAG: ParA family protein [Oscillospiraceae bacterium]|nr:ParA family protein [Oscillospiraceae bacterium]
MAQSTIITGHYGAGKTTVALALAYDAAAAGHSVTLVDLDIVNPYFRSGDDAATLEKQGIRVIAPAMSGTTSDAPALRAEIFSAFNTLADVVLFDVGGDDVGATALGRFHENFEQSGYEMHYVFSAYRPMTRTPEACVEILRDIEQASRLRATGLIVNHNLAADTSAQDILDQLPYARAVAQLTNLPIIAVNVPEGIDIGEIPEPMRTIKRRVKLPWETRY